jgi:hypothetical protein
MKIPSNLQLHEHEMATVWFDEEGILCVVVKNGPRNVSSMNDYYQFVNKITNGKKVRILTDITGASPMDTETRAHAARILPMLFSAMAIISDSHIGLLMGQTFLELSDQPYPTGIFQNSEEALAWLKKQAE